MKAKGPLPQGLFELPSGAELADQSFDDTICMQDYDENVFLRFQMSGLHPVASRAADQPTADCVHQELGASSTSGAGGGAVAAGAAY